MDVLIRVDASPVIGNGHLMRCLTLAHQLHEQGMRVTFACRALEGAPLSLLPAVYDSLRLPGHYAHELPAHCAEQHLDPLADSDALCEQLGSRRFDWCVVDHYGLDAQWHGRARAFARRIMVIDDLANRSLDCDVLLDSGLHPDPESRYAECLQNGAKCLFGPSYALIREEFIRARQQAAPRLGEMRRIVVFFTGGDDQGETLKALEALTDWKEPLDVDVVVGQGHDHEVIAALCRTRDWRMHCQVDYMARLMAEADLSLGAAGSSSWERCAVGLPSLLVILAENQRELAAGLARQGVAQVLGDARSVTRQDYCLALEQLTPDCLRRLSENSWRQVDGLGALRASRVLLDLSTCP